MNVPVLTEYTDSTMNVRSLKKYRQNTLTTSIHEKTENSRKHRGFVLFGLKQL